MCESWPLGWQALIGAKAVLATRQCLVAVGPASKWNGSTILRGHAQDMMAAAESTLNAQAREATRVELGFAAADDWLAAKLADPVLFKQVLLAQSAEEYQELMGLMSEDGCKWAQVGTCDWGDDAGVVKERAWGEALLSEYSPEGSVMSDVVEAPAVDGKAEGGEGFTARLHGIDGLMVVQPAVEASRGRKLFEGLEGRGQDDLSAVLGEKGKGKMPSRWAGELDEVDFSVDEMDVGDMEPPMATGAGEDRVCGGHCLARIAALEETLGRVVKANNKGVKRRELDDGRAEEARLHQEEVVKAKEAARAVAEAERDRLVADVTVRLCSSCLSCHFLSVMPCKGFCHPVCLVMFGYHVM